MRTNWLPAIFCLISNCYAGDPTRLKPDLRALGDSVYRTPAALQPGLKGIMAELDNTPEPAAPEVAETPAPPKRADYIPFRAEMDRNLYGGISARATSCVRAMQDMLNDNPQVTVSIEALTRRTGQQIGRDTTVWKDVPDLNPDGTQKLALVLHDQENKLKLVINPYDKSHGFRLRQDDGSTPSALSESAPPEARRLNELAADGKSFQEIMANEPDVRKMVDTMFAKADETTPDHTSGTIEKGARAAVHLADSGLRKEILKNSIAAFSLADGVRAMADGRITQGLLDFARIIPVAGPLATQALQTMANKAGLDVDPSAAQLIGTMSGITSAGGPSESFNGMSGCGTHGKPLDYYIARDTPSSPEPAVDTGALGKSLPAMETTAPAASTGPAPPEAKAALPQPPIP